MPPHLPQNLKPYIKAAGLNLLLISYANRCLNLGLLKVRLWMQRLQKQRLGKRAISGATTGQLALCHLLSLSWSRCSLTVFRWMTKQFEGWGRGIIFLLSRCISTLLLYDLHDPICMSCVIHPPRLNVLISISCVSLGAPKRTRSLKTGQTFHVQLDLWLKSHFQVSTLLLDIDTRTMYLI